MRLFKPFSSICWACTTALALSGVATIATAQGAPASALPPAQATVQTPLLTTAASPTSTPLAESPSAAASSAASTADVPVTLAATEVPTPRATTSSAVEAPQSMNLERVLEILEPIFSNPLTGAGTLLALMLVFAVLVYRRNQQAVLLVPSSLKRRDNAPKEEPAQTEPKEPLLVTRGLQAEIMALDLELGPSEAPSSTPVAPLPSKLAQPSGADLSLSKLQWAQQLLAAGENELARVLLTSVAESLQIQLQMRNASLQGPRQ